jgi:hypothetical protein
MSLLIYGLLYCDGRLFIDLSQLPSYKLCAQTVM